MTDASKPAWLEEWEAVRDGVFVDPYDHRKGVVPGRRLSVFNQTPGANEVVLGSLLPAWDRDMDERTKLAAAAPALVRALLKSEWSGGWGEGTAFAGDVRQVSACPACSGEGERTVSRPQVGSLGWKEEVVSARHHFACPLDAALTLAGFPDQASRNAAREMMRGTE